ncbi:MULTISPECIES: UvrD-helicase domain-containing protein [Rhodomicrobium]|uniref:ATP-dependent helicase n=1 Tax=Rhodomicrobium TaxID=1068 RepID=UPI001FDA0E03|nr:MULTISPECIES: UvrD-helicase domain-containing protein [Rhodomicrobium]
MKANRKDAPDAEPTPPHQGEDGALIPLSRRAMAAPPYLNGLNPEQREAVVTLDGPVLVLAGAGTGKTRVLTTRIAHILATQRAFPSQILAVTFTNKAAREMKQRIGALVGGAVEGMPWLGTFHSIGARILRYHAELVGLTPAFTVLDTDDQLRLLKQLIQADRIDEKRWTPRHLAGLIDSWKNRGMTPDKVPAGEAFAFANGKGAELYAAYQKRLKELNAADFGDLLLENLRLFMEHPEILKSFHERFRFMLVDEYQDTNVAQYLWLRLLAQGNHNVCCVGDDDQSIYGWRGAEVDNILRFEADFPGAKVIRLERNYRSTGNILGAASHLIAHNQGRLGKTLHTDDAAGEKLILRGVWDDEAEARAVSDEIADLHRQGMSYNDMAILVRASFQMRAFEDRFVAINLPYRVIGGPRFYERQEIKDAIAYLDVANNPANDLKFERIVNVPKRGLGETALRTIHHFARAEGRPLFDAARTLAQTEELKPQARKPLLTLVQSFDRWRGMLNSMHHTEVAQIILDESGYTEMWQNDKTPQAPARLENLKELIRFMGEFDTLGAFLEHVSLVMDAEQNSDGERVSVMTLHAAKGLEFDMVFLPGWEEGLFPHQRSMDESGVAGLEEERRLAYVGITRAKKRAHISFAQNRRVHGLWQTAVPSRFVDELPEAHVDPIQDASSMGGYGNGPGFSEMGAGRTNAGYSSPGWQRAQSFYQTQQNAAPRRRAATTIEGELVASSSGDAGYELGERIFHDKFGYGLISEIDGNKLTVDFEKAGRKRVVASFVTRP